MFLTIREFIGNFHPLIVHLPIGILLFGILIQILSKKEKYTALKPAVPVTYLVGSLCAILSVITGLLLSGSDGYDKSTLNIHEWLGIATTLLACAAFVYKDVWFQKIIPWVLLLMLTLTGHLGGTLTHGEGYLTNALYDDANIIKRKPLVNLEEALVYDSIVSPILQSKCYSCHGPHKQKGKLRMDIIEKFKLGGKDGQVFEAGKPDESEMIKRINLAKSDDDHMPPKSKTQLTKDEIKILHWWIQEGASFDKKVKDIIQTDEVKPALAALKKPLIEKEIDSGIPDVAVEAADESVINSLKEKGIHVLPVSQGSNYLHVNFINTSSVDEASLKLLEQLQKQVIWLNMASVKLTDESCMTISKLSRLRKLYLQNSTISDEGLSKLSTLKDLQLINLAGTRVTDAGLVKLSGLKELRHIYVYGSEVKTSDYGRLKSLFASAEIDTGGYFVPTLVSDTTVFVKEIPKKN